MSIRSPLPHVRCVLAAVTIAMMISMLTPAAGGAAVGDCGLPLSSTTPRTSDCLFVLRAAVQTETCAPCTCDVDDSGQVAASDALLCLRFAVGQDVALSCPPCVECPPVVQWTTHAAIGPSCDSNGDCAAGACDPDLGRCRTASEIDVGWTGRAHDASTGEGATLLARIACDDDGQFCGTCEVEGVEPSAATCRCASDSRIACDTPFAADDACPACDGGVLEGRACDVDGDCDAGTCARYCAFDPELACTTNTDCPFGRRRCLDESRCGSADGNACATNADCSGTCSGVAVCECFDGPPQPVASVTFPFCIVPRLASDLAGTVNLETGASVLVRDLVLRAYGGTSLRTPCPVCAGTCSTGGEPCAEDADCEAGQTCIAGDVAGDAERDGTCFGGEHHGQPCDVMAIHASFPPAPDLSGSGSTGTSLDCLPDANADFTGPGLRGVVVETTGTTSLEASLDCDGTAPGGLSCPCLVCTGGDNLACRSDDDCALLQSCAGQVDLGCSANADCEDVDLGACTAVGSTRCTGSLSTPCTTNADCAGVDFGPCEVATCSSAGIGAVPQPDDCSGVCAGIEDGEASCATGPDDAFCDALLTADGRGIRRCFTNADCGPAELGFDAGDCTLVERRDCFASPITADGTADPDQPLYVGAFCVSPTSSVGANEALGLPGPVRIRRQTTLEPVFPEASPSPAPASVTPFPSRSP